MFSFLVHLIWAIPFLVSWVLLFLSDVFGVTVRPLTHPDVWCEQKQFSGSDLFKVLSIILS
jgi:hypothetical protein